MGPTPREAPGMACSACYYLVISSTHLSNGHFRRVKGVFRGPLCPPTSSDSPERAERALGCSVEDLKALFYCELCQKQYLRHQEFDNHINSYDHAHKQRLKELKHREFARNVASKSWKDQRKQEKALRRLHQLAQLQQDTQRVQGGTYGLRRAVRTVSKQQDKHQRDHSPEDKLESLNHTQKPAPSPLAAAPLSQLLKNPYQSPFQIPLATALAESQVITHPASGTGTAASNPKSLLGLYPEVPLPGRGRAGGRLGVSFCFSRRGPRLEPSASVFSDLEEEERDKREQMKERIKGIMEDIYREIEEVEGRKHSESEKFKSCAVGDGPSDTAPIPRDAPRDEEEIEKRDKEKEPFPISTAAPDNLNPDSLLRPSQTQTTLCGTEPAGAHTDIKHTDGATARKRESEGEREDNQYMCVQGKDGSTCLKWPVSLIKFTKSQPHICYSSNPLCSDLQQAEQLSQDSKEPEQNLPSALSGKSNPCVPAIITADTHTCLQRHGSEELRAHTQQKVEENFKAQGRVDAEEGEHLFLENGNLSSSETTPETERCTLSTENCASPASHPFDPADSDSSNANFQNPLGGRLGGARRIRERAIAALSCKSESVILTGAQGMCISPSRCECGSETTCQCASAAQPYVGVLELSRKRRKASTKKDKLGKKRGKRENTSNKRQSARRKVRSVVSTVSTVSTGTERREEAGGSWGKRRLEQAGMRRRRVQSAGSSSHPGRCEAEPVSVFVRKRRPHRSPSSESQSEADREQAERCSVSSPLGRHTAHRDTTREARRDRDALTFPWRSHFSLHSLSSGCNSKLSWERGHHSNPRSFIDCCYPDNSCVCSPARKGKVLHRDRIFIHRKRKSLRRHNVWEETGRGGKTGVPSGGRDGGHISDLEEWEWMRGSFPERRRSRNNAAEWDGLAKFRSSPGSWCRKSSQLGRDDVDWDRCSVDRWTWGSSDSWEDRGTHRSVSGSRRGADSRESPDSVWKCLGSRSLNTKQVSSPEWWTSRQTYSPQSAINTRASRGHSPRSCSPCSSTSMSELSWEWSRSSTSSGVDGLTGGSCRSLSGAQGLSSEGPQEATKQSSPTPSGLNSTSHSSPHKSRLAPPVPGVIKKHCDTNPSQPKELKSQSDLGHSAPVTTSTPDATTGLSRAKSGPQKSARTLLLPLIGKLPAIQRKARRKKGFLGRSQEKKVADKEEAKGNAGDPEAVTNSQKYPPVTAESLPSSTPNPHPSEIRTDDKHVVEETAPPISFTAEEMDKYRLLQEQAREHMQKVLEQTQESADTEANYAAQTDERGASEERYTPAPIHNPALPQSQSVHTDSVQTQAQHSLQVSLPIPHVTSQENFSQPIALGVPSLPALPPSPPLPGLHHIILQRATVPMPPASSSSPVSSPSPAAVHPHHPLPPPHLSLPHHLHLLPLSISSLFPSILLSHHPIPLLPQSAAFHGTPLAPLPSVTLQPLNPQPFVSTSWPVRFQQKAL